MISERQLGILNMHSYVTYSHNISMVRVRPFMSWSTMVLHRHCHSVRTEWPAFVGCAICFWTMMTPSNENIFRVTGLCEGISPVTGEFPSQRPVTRSFDVFFGLPLNKRLNKHSIRWWFETPSRSLWGHSNDCRIKYGAQNPISLIKNCNRGWKSTENVH